MTKNEKNSEQRLDYLKKGQPFRVPENYFETFNERLKDRITFEDRLEKRNRFLIYLKPVLGLAASFALVFLLVYVPLVKFIPGKNYMAQQKADTITNGLTGGITSDYLSYFTEGQFFSAFEDVNEFETKSISSDEIVEYLAANCSDYEIIKEHN